MKAVRIVAASFWICTAAAQFQFFDNMFQHQQHQQRPDRGANGASQWAIHAENIPCSRYLCPVTLECVDKPVDCPCPNIQDTKCIIEDTTSGVGGTVVCARGSDGCAAVERLAKRTL